VPSGRVPDGVDNVAQVMLEADVVIELEAVEGTFDVARDRPKCGMDFVSREADADVANRGRQIRCGRAPIDRRNFLRGGRGFDIRGAAIARQCNCASLGGRHRCRVDGPQSCRGASFILSKAQRAIAAG
jgi:hypothetical protein